MTVSAVDRLYLRSAIRLAEKGLFSVTTNNPRVGCLLVKNGHIIGQGWHREDGGPHAEIDALSNTIEDPRGSTAYVSLEPCCWEGANASVYNCAYQGGDRSDRDCSERSSSAGRWRWCARVVGCRNRRDGRKFI